MSLKSVGEDCLQSSSIYIYVFSGSVSICFAAIVTNIFFEISAYILYKEGIAIYLFDTFIGIYTLKYTQNFAYLNDWFDQK